MGRLLFHYREAFLGSQVGGSIHCVPLFNMLPLMLGPIGYSYHLGLGLALSSWRGVPCYTAVCGGCRDGGEQARPRTGRSHPPAMRSWPWIGRRCTWKLTEPICTENEDAESLWRRPTRGSSRRALGDGARTRVPGWRGSPRRHRCQPW